MQGERGWYAVDLNSMLLLRCAPCRQARPLHKLQHKYAYARVRLDDMQCRNFFVLQANVVKRVYYLACTTTTCCSRAARYALRMRILMIIYAVV